MAAILQPLFWCIGVRPVSEIVRKPANAQALVPCVIAWLWLGVSGLIYKYSVQAPCDRRRWCVRRCTVVNSLFLCFLLSNAYRHADFSAACILSIDAGCLPRFAIRRASLVQLLRSTAVMFFWLLGGFRVPWAIIELRVYIITWIHVSEVYTQFYGERCFAEIFVYFLYLLSVLYLINMCRLLFWLSFYRHFPLGCSLNICAAFGMLITTLVYSFWRSHLRTSLLPAGLPASRLGWLKYVM